VSPFVFGLLVAVGGIAGSTVVVAVVVVVVAAVVVPTLVVVFVPSWLLGRGPALLCLRLASSVLGLLPVGGAVGGGHPGGVWKTLDVLCHSTLTRGELVFLG